jgi:autotransporter-associated beta strand protein
MNSLFTKTFFLLFLPCVSVAQTNNYFGTAGTINGSVWSTNPAGPYTSTLNSTSGAILNFNNAGSATGAAVTTVSGINCGASVTWTAGGTISNTGTNLPINVASGVVQNFAGQAFSTAAGFGITKNGAGTLQLIGSAWPGGFTLNAGMLAAGGINAMGGAAGNTLTSMAAQ